MFRVDPVLGCPSAFVSSDVYFFLELVSFSVPIVKYLVEHPRIVRNTLGVMVSSNFAWMVECVSEIRRATCSNVCIRVETSATRMTKMVSKTQMSINEMLYQVIICLFFGWCMLFQ